MFSLHIEIVPFLVHMAYPSNFLLFLWNGRSLILATLSRSISLNSWIEQVPRVLPYNILTCS